MTWAFREQRVDDSATSAGFSRPQESRRMEGGQELRVLWTRRLWLAD
jgi:hypothetical protein